MQLFGKKSEDFQIQVVEEPKTESALLSKHHIVNYAQLQSTSSIDQEGEPNSKGMPSSPKDTQ